MKSLALAGAAVLAVALPASTSAQSMPSDNAAASDQQSAYQTWPPERQRSYDAWPADVQSYFWTLTPREQAGWWLLTDDQRTRIHAMTPQQRAQAWNAISAQLASSRAGYGNTAANGGSRANSGEIRWVSNAVVQPIANDEDIYDGGKIPICEENEFDNCMNAWAAGLRGPGVERPLDYWPGEKSGSRD
jgi:hypothetical protein